MHAIGEHRRSVASVDESGVAQPRTLRRRLATNSDRSVIVRAHTQSESHDSPNNLDNAYGISIYLPLGEAAKETGCLAYYADPDRLLFTRDVPEWAGLVEELTASAPQHPITQHPE